MVRVPKYIRNHDSDLDPLWHLRESQLKKQQKHIKGTTSDAVIYVVSCCGS